MKRATLQCGTDDDVDSVKIDFESGMCTKESQNHT